MGVKELRQLEGDDQAFNNFLKGAYNKVKKQHSASIRSWWKTRWRSRDKKASAVNTAGQVGTFGGAALGGAGLLGATVLATGTGGALVVTVPAVIGLATLVYWRDSKREHHNVNEEIWRYYGEHQDPDPKNMFKLLADASGSPKIEDVNKWLGWFGDEGFGNMKDLEAKLKEAQTKFDNNFQRLCKERNALFENRVKPWLTGRASTPQAKEHERQEINRAADDLANKCMALAQDLMYVYYRLERTFMYYEMLGLTVKRLQEDMTPKLASVLKAASDFFEKNMAAYTTLWDAIANVD